MSLLICEGSNFVLFYITERMFLQIIFTQKFLVFFVSI
jgi:hypothetical protein